MIRKTILYTSAIFIVILACIIGNPGFAIIGVIPLAAIWAKHKEKSASHDLPQEGDETFATLDEVIARYGDPDDMVVTNAARAHDLDGGILVYDRLKMLIIQGKPVDMRDITDITFNNSETPYAVPQYQILIVTEEPKRRTTHIPVGNDCEWAKQVVLQLNEHLKL